MEHTGLNDLLTCLTFDSKIHIAVVFLRNSGNNKTELSDIFSCHSKPFCAHMKKTPEGYEKCFVCRNEALNQAVSERKPFGRFCINGVYEYCHPVIYENEVVAVIFLGNIIKGKCEGETEAFSGTFIFDVPDEITEKIAYTVDNHIKLLLSEYAKVGTSYSPLVRNIINFIEESLYSDVSVNEIASLFNYNEKYIGKLFKSQTGFTVKEYLNKRRLDNAEKLLRNTKIPITEISSKSGFNNVTYFNRLFKKHFNLSPKDYRKAIKK